MRSRITPPFVLLDFRADEADDGAAPPLLFRAPARMLAAHALDEVRAVLRAAAAEAGRGRHVAGFVSYDAAPAFDPAMTARRDPTLPLAWFGAFDAPEPFDVASLETAEARSVRWSPTRSREEYEDEVERIRESIAAGDVYQVNHTMRLLAPAVGDPLAFWARIRRSQRARYAAFVDLGTHQLLSISPELFFSCRDGRVVTRPMKGTAARGRWPEEDDARAEALRASEKDRAENVMIVDLLRNDLGRVARPGSVRVPQLFEVERYPTVLQMTSSVEARLEDEVGLERLFEALFPCGSVTGAPKVAAMRAIAALEEEPRGIYCGAIGHVAPGAPLSCTFNVAIRTVQVDAAAGTMRYGVGGGVTWDSTPAGEHAEALAKAGVLAAERPEFSLLETMRLEHGRVARLERHLHRLEQSARYFGFEPPGARARRALDDAARALPADDVARLRLLADERGQVLVDRSPLPATPSPARVVLASGAVSRDDVFLHHKTTHRAAYERARAEAGSDAFDVLLWNEKGELTEFTIGNLVVELDGARWTPPRDCGLLAGVFRAELLDRREVGERVLRVDDLRNATRVWLVNSLREWVRVDVAPDPGPAPPAGDA